jgi:hypothetical protein
MARAVMGQMNFAVRSYPRLDFNWMSETYSYSTRSVETYKEGTDKAASYTQTTTVTHHDRSGELNSPQFTSTFIIAAQLWLKPSKFRINVGSEFANVVGTWTTTNWTSVDDKVTTTVEKKYDDGTVVPKVTTITPNPGSETTRQTFTSAGTISKVVYRFGPTFYLNEYVNFDILIQNQTGTSTDWTSILFPSTWALQFNIQY